MRRIKNMLLILGVVSCMSIAGLIAYDAYFRRISIRPDMNEYEKSFTDPNHTHLRAAKKNGITPAQTRADFDAQLDNLVKIQTCEKYYLAKLTASVPYAVPSVESFLDELSDRFRELSHSKSRFIVTSVTRSAEDVSKLKETNVNAVNNSAHRYGTTIDIAYNNFKGDILAPRSNEELRTALSQALRQMQKDGRCYVKYESKQKCYHITVR